MRTLTIIMGGLVAGSFVYLAFNPPTLLRIVVHGFAAVSVIMFASHLATQLDRGR